MKKIFLMLAVIAMCALIVVSFSIVSCKKEEAQVKEDVAEESEEEGAPSGAEITGEKVELVMWEQSAEWRIKAQQSTIDAFMAEHPNVSIKIESFPFVEYQPKINSAIQTGTAADIIAVVGGQWDVPLIMAGLVSEIPEDVMSIKELEEEYFNGPANASIFDGKVYSIPNHVNMGIGGLVYNVDLLKEAGIIKEDGEHPKFETWEEFIEAAQKCTKFDEDGTMTQAGFSQHGVLDFFSGMSYVLQEGGEVIKDGKVAFNNESGLAALQIYQDIFLKYKVDDPLFIGGLDGFPQGRVAMMNIGGWAGKAAETQNPDLEVGYGDQVPSINPDYPAYSDHDACWAFIVPENSENKDIIWEFLKFYKEEDQWVNRVQYDGELPALKSAAEKFLDDDVMDAYVKAAEYSIYTGYKVDREKFNSTVTTYLEQLARGDLTPEQALEGLTEDLNKVLSGQ